MKLKILFGMVVMISQVSLAQVQPPDTTVSGSIDVTRGAIQELEKELELNVTRTKFSVTDYKAWNAQYRAQLESEMGKLAARVEKDVAAKLSPLAEQYNQILVNSSSLSPEQFESLKTMQMARLNDMATALTPIYANIYMDMVQNLMGWLPVITVGSQSEAQNHHTINRVFSTIFAITLVGGAIELMNSDAFFKSTDYLGTRFDYTVKALNNAKGSPKFEGTVANGGHKIQVGDLSTVFRYVDEDMQKHSHSLMEAYFIPAVKKDCKSQACLALKESDLKLTLSKLATDIDQDFWIKFKDEKVVKIPAPVFHVESYKDYLGQPITDPKMSFDWFN